MLDPLILRVNGNDYGGWKQATVTASANEAVRSFTVKTTERAPDWPIKPMDEVEVIAFDEDGNEEVMVKGYVDSYKAELSAENHEAEISGRGKTCDLVDCSAVHDTGRFEKKDIGEIGKELAQRYGVKIVVKAKNLSKIEKFQINQGESVFTALERIARSQDLLLVGNAKGELEIWDEPEGMVGVELIEGETDVLTISVEIDASKRQKEYTVKAQRSGSFEAKDIRIEKKSVDGSVKRVRGKIIIAEGDITEEGAKKRADNEMSTRQGESIKASCTVSGFFNAKGKLWKPGTQVYVKFPTIHLDQTMAIESVEFTKDAQDSTQTKLTLNDPRALKAKKKDSRSKSGSAYNIDKSKDAANRTGGSSSSNVG